ncbi:MAG: MATE family efflux transporter [Planctomycetota bacterium]
MSQPGPSLTEGPLLRAVLRVGVPASCFQLLIFLNNVIDYLWVQALGDAAASGLTAGWTLFWMLASLGQIFSTGVTAVVARRIGEQRHGEAVHAATHGAKGALLGAVLVGTAGWLLVPGLVAGNQLSPLASRHTLDYLRTLCLGAPLVFLFYAFVGTFKGHGDMRRPLRAILCAVLLNMLLDPLLIRVAGLGVLGAALATVAAFGLTGLLLGWAATRRGWIAWDGPSLDLRLVGRVLRIGTPISIHGIVFSAVYIFIVREVNLAGGDPATAALGLGLRVEGFAYMTSVGFASAAAAVVGQNLGARQVRRAHDGAWLAVRVGAWLSGLWGLLCFLLPAAVVTHLSSGPQATSYAVLYFEITAVSYAFTAVEIVLEGAFSGAGDTRPAIFLGLPLTVARIPAAMVAARALDWGVAGVFWALTATSVIRGLLFAFWFARGRWVHGQA